MNETFKALSISYKTASVAIREQVALTPETLLRYISYIKSCLPITEMIVISTCNRTEVYYVSEVDLTHALYVQLFQVKGQNAPSSEAPYIHLEKENAIEHLYRVSLGLESMVVGDLQISNQVKQAYQLSVDHDFAGPFMHRLMHSIFYTNKKVVQETAFRDGAASVSYAAYELVEELASSLHQPRIALVGVGEIGSDVIRHLKGSRYTDVRILNRTFEKAENLALECGFKAIEIDQLKDQVLDADIIISSVAREEPIIKKEMLEGSTLLTHKFFIDLSVPRSIDPDIEQLAGVLVYNIDQIRNRTEEAVSRRIEAIPEVEALMYHAISDFLEWTREMFVSPTIQKLKNSLEQIRQEEMSRHLKNLSEDEIERMEKITKGMMQKIIKNPVLQLKAACKRGEAESLVDVIHELFNLEKTENVSVK